MENENSKKKTTAPDTSVGAELSSKSKINTN